MKFPARKLELGALMILLSGLVACAAPVEQGVAVRIDRLGEIGRVAYGGENPGGAVLVMQADSVILTQGYGLADLEWDEPVTAKTSFRIGSVSKPFTAVLVLQLVEANRVDLDRPVSDYLDGLPGVLGEPTVRQLLSHTSGLPDHFAQPQIVSVMRNPVTPDGIIAMMDQVELQFEPGTRFQYSNFNYVLLGQLIEAMDDSGRDYGNIVEQELFAPLGMVDSHYDRQSAVIPGRARGYDHDGTGPINTITFETSLAYAAGALMSSASDLALFTNALRDHRLLGVTVQTQAFTAVTLPNGESTGYGLGFNVSEFMGETVIWHSGSINGFQATWIHMPSVDHTVAVLSNGYYRTNTTTSARRILAELAGMPVPRFEDLEFDDQAWSELEGRYRLDDGRILQMHIQDGARFSFDGEAWDELGFSGHDVFHLPDTLIHLELHRADNQHISGMTYVSNTLDRYEAVRVDGEIEGAQRSIALNATEAGQLTGRWAMVSGDLVRVTLEGKTMALQLPSQAGHPIYPSAPHNYFMRDMPLSIVFSENGQSAEMTLYGRVHQLTRD